MGSSLAYWLTRLDPKTTVTVIERDLSYRQASSALSAASIRRQFTTPLNIRISERSFAFLATVGESLEVGGERPNIQFHAGGYLYLARRGEADRLSAAHRVQRATGAEVELLDPAALKRQFPWLHVDDLSLGSLGTAGEGWFDGQGLLMALARRARAQGAAYHRAEAVSMTRVGARVTAVQLSDGERVSTGLVVNAAGAWAGRVAALIDIPVPISARRRTVFVLRCPTTLVGMPLLIDPTGFWIRPEGAGFIAGAVPINDAPDLPLEPDHHEFESRLWPALAGRIPAFEAARVEGAWAGYYDMNDFDHNAIIGPHPVVGNFHLMTGFSGHGMQQAPAIGESLATYVLTGRYGSLDLTPLGFDRVDANRPFPEFNIIG
jgi:glycine/D-amino acid oxidase-like deaminating enzyme